MPLPDSDDRNEHHGAHRHEHCSSEDDENSLGSAWLIPYTIREKYSWPQNWSRKESQYTGSYVIWRNHFGLKEKEWTEVGAMPVAMSAS